MYICAKPAMLSSPVFPTGHRSKCSHSIPSTVEQFGTTTVHFRLITCPALPFCYPPSAATGPGISGGAIAGIVIGVLVCVVLIVVVVAVMYSWRERGVKNFEKSG